MESNHSDALPTESDLTILKLDLSSLLAAVTGGALTIRNSAPQHMRMILQTFARLGIRTEIKGEDIYVAKNQHPSKSKKSSGVLSHTSRTLLGLDFQPI